GHRDRQGQEQLDRAGLALLRPQPHRDRRDQEEVEPGMEAEEGLQIGLAAVEEIAEIEGEGAGQRQEDDEEDIGDGCREIAAELAAHDEQDVAHQAFPAVMERKTSSRRPRSTRTSSMPRSSVRARRLMSAMIGCPLAGKATRQTRPSSPSICSISETCCTRSIAVRAAPALVPRSTTETALCQRDRASSS